MIQRPPKLVLFFTWDVSLALWEDKGLLAREIRFYEALVAQGVDVTFLTWGDERDAQIAAALAGIKVVPLYTRLSLPKNKALRALVSLWAPVVARETLKDADIIKTNQMWGAWAAVLSKWLYRKPLLVRTGFELYDFTRRQGHGPLRRALISLLSRIAYGAANRVHMATEEDRDFIIRKFRTPSGKIKLMPNWIDTDFFKPGAESEKAETVLYVGRLSVQKNLEALIDALEGTGWTLEIAGEGELKKVLSDRAEQKNVSVNFLGKVDNDALPALYNSVPVFVLPSHYEGNPKALLEAMACGRAVIGTDVPGIASLIEAGRTGLLCAPGPQALQSAIKRLMDDKPLRARLGAAARAQIEKRNRLDKLVAEEIETYRFLQGASS